MEPLAPGQVQAAKLHEQGDKEQSPFKPPWGRGGAAERQAFEDRVEEEGEGVEEEEGAFGPIETEAFS